MHNTTKLLINHIFAHLLLIPAFLYGTWWMWLCGFLWWYVIAIVSISGGYHRYYSHKAFKADKWYEWAVNFLGVFSGAGPAMTWAAVHKQHHAYSDTENDPHSYQFKGIGNVYFSIWGYSAKIKRKFVKQLIKNPILKLFYDYYFMINISIIVLLFAIHPLLLVFAYGIPVVIAFHGYGLLNLLGHKNAKPHNSWIANILTAGEGWHANHHDRAFDYKIGQKWWEIDPTAWFIKLIKV